MFATGQYPPEFDLENPEIVPPMAESELNEQPKMTKVNTVQDFIQKHDTQ